MSLNIDRGIRSIPLTSIQKLIGQTPSEILDTIASLAAPDDTTGVAYGLRLGLFPLHLGGKHSCDGSLQIQRMSAWRDIKIDMNERATDAIERVHRQLAFSDPQQSINLAFFNWNFQSGDAFSRLGLNLPALALRCRNFTLRCKPTNPNVPATFSWMSSNSSSWELARPSSWELAPDDTGPMELMDPTKVTLTMLRSEGDPQLLTSPMRMLAFGTPLMRRVYINTDAADFGRIVEGDAWTRRPIFLAEAPMMEEFVLHGRLSSIVFAVECWPALRRLEVAVPLSIQAVISIAAHCTILEQLYIRLEDADMIPGIPAGVYFSALEIIVATSQQLLDLAICHIGAPVLREVWLAIDDIEERVALQIAVSPLMARIGPHYNTCCHETVRPSGRINAARAKTTCDPVEIVLRDLCATELERFFRVWSQEGCFALVQRIVLRNCELSPFNVSWAGVIARQVVDVRGSLVVEGCRLERGKETRPDSVVELLDALVKPILAGDLIAVDIL